MPRPSVKPTVSLGSTIGVAKATIAEPDKTARHQVRIEENANDVASFVNLLRRGSNFRSRDNQKS